MNDVEAAWGSRGCVQQNQAMEGVEKVRDALRETESVNTARIVAEFKRGLMTNGEFVDRLQSEWSTTKFYLTVLNRISSRINA